MLPAVACISVEAAQRIQCLAHLLVENRDVLLDGMLTALLLNLLLPLLGLKATRGNRILLEHLQRPGEPANLIGPVGALDLDVEIAVGELRHLAGHEGERSGNLIERDPAEDGERADQPRGGADHQPRPGVRRHGDAGVACRLHFLHVQGNQLANRRDGNLAMLCRHAARMLESLLRLAGEREFEHLGACITPSVDGGAEGVDEGALVRILGDGLKAADRVEGGCGCLAVKLDMPLCHLFVVAENHVLFADGGVVEGAFGLKSELDPRGVAIHQSRRGVRQMGHRQRRIEHDPDRDDGNDRCWNRNLGDDSDIAES